jgi:hemerythrin
VAIKWREELSIDRGTIDQDHHTLIGIINAFEAIKPGPQAMAGLADVLEQLSQYGPVHFEREEQLQRAVSFPYAQAHNQQHRLLLRNLAGARQELATVASEKDLAMFRLHMCGFLHGWLVDHIIQSDLMMKPFVHTMAPHAALIDNLHAAVRAMAAL